jgi:dipeptidyl aminopeptidase/acylaminoacyl peptidase
MKSTLARALLLAACVFTPATALARPMTIADLLGAIRVSDPQLSPDGRLVAFVRTATDVATGTRNADIWVVPADGSSAPRLLIGGEKNEDTPRWDPSGEHLAFISTRDGDPQIFIADADGGHVRQLTKIRGGVQPPMVIAPDRSMIAFVSDVKITPDPPVLVHHLTRLLYRHWDEWRENVRHHVFVASLAGGDPKDLTPGDFDSPPGQQEDNAIAFTPDSRELVFVSNREGNDKEAWTTNNDVWSVPVTGGTPKKLTENPAADVQPVFTPDGKSMIVRAQRRPGFESDRWYLDVYDRANGHKRTVFQTPDLSVSDFTLTKDGGTILFTAPNGGVDVLYRVPLAGGTPQVVAKGGAIAATQRGGDFAVIAKSTLTSPAELFRVAYADGAQQPITRENDSWLKQVTFEKTESLAVPGAGGTPIQYFLLKPPGFDPSKKYPVVFLIHGGPQVPWEDAWSYRWNPSLWAAQGWVIVLPNPRGSPGFGQQFVDEISQDWGGKVMTDLDAVFDAVVRLPYVDSTKQGIAGASYGGYAVDWLITQTNRFKVAVTHDGVFNLESMALATEEQWFVDWEFGGPPLSAAARANYAKWSPSRYAQNIKTPTLVITNERDFRVPTDQGLQLFTALRRNGVPSEALVFSEEGHWVLKALDSKYWHESVFGWLHKYLND